jgi:integrase
VTRHLAPAFTRVKLVELRPDHLQIFYGQKLDPGPGKRALSVRSVHHLHRVIHNALSDAVDLGDVARNVADMIKPPSPPRKEQTVWNPDQARTFIAGARGERFEAAFILAITCGMRAGELCGLKWEDVDLNGGILQIRRTRQRVRRATVAEGQKKTVVADGTPKTKKGERTIVLPAVAIGALKRWRGQQLEQRLAAGPFWVDASYVFTHLNGTGLDTQKLYHAFVAVETKLGLPRIRLHDLRHTCATVLLAQGVHAKYVQELLGHSQIAVTMDLYSAFLPPMAKEAARTMDALFAAG